MARDFVEIDRVSLRYAGADGTLALHGASLNVREGEFLAVVGPSGCGKSTLMRLVTGLWLASQGSVKVAVRAVAGPLIPVPGPHAKRPEPALLRCPASRRRRGACLASQQLPAPV